VDRLGDGELGLCSVKIRSLSEGRFLEFKFPAKAVKVWLRRPRKYIGIVLNHSLERR
jgi:hypothetical protein